MGDDTYRGDESLVCADLIVRLFEPISKGTATAISQRSSMKPVALQLFQAHSHYSQQIATPACHPASLRWGDRHKLGRGSETARQ